MGLLNFLFIFTLLIAMPLNQITRIPLGDAAITLLDFSVFLLVSVWVIRIPRNKIKSPLIKPILIFVSALFISLLVNLNRLSLPQFVVSFLYLLRWALYASAFLVVKNINKNKVSVLLKSSGLIIMLVGLVLYFFYPDLRNLRYLGWDEHLYRNFSTFLDPNFAGIFFVLYFVFVIDLLNFRRIFSKSQLVNIFLTLLSVISVLLTFSRSAYISFVIAIIAFAFIKKEFKALIIILLFLIGLFFISSFTLKSEGTNLLREASGKARVDSINRAVTIFKDYPIFGVGFDAYRYAQRWYGFVDESKMLIHSAAGTDNSFLFILATSGVLGFSAFIFLLFNLFKASLNFPVLLISLIVISFNSLFINSLFYPPLMLWVWVLVGFKKSS